MKLAIAIALATLLFLPAALAAPSQGAHIGITRLSPFTVHGSGFIAGERVNLTVAAKRRVARSVVATTKGTFTARFQLLRLGRCTSYVVRVIGRRGSVVTKKVVPQCAPLAVAGEEPTVLLPDRSCA